MYDTGVPFSHPWPEDVIVKIGGVTVGGTPRTSIEKYWNGDVPWMTSGDVHRKRITDVPTRISELGLRSSNATLVDPPAVAIGLAGQGKTRGTVALVLCRLCTNQSVALISADPSKLAIAYLLYNLEFRYDELRSRSAGGGRAGLSKQLIEQIPVPLPPVPEQGRIADILSTVDQAIEQTRDLIAKHERIKAGLMQDLFTSGIDANGKLRTEQTHKFKESAMGRIPVEWDVRTLQGTGMWASGGTPAKGNPSYWRGDIPWICPKDMKAFELKATTDYLTRSGVRHGSKEMPADTVFIVVRGMILAHTFPVCITDRPAAFNQDVKAIRVNSDVDARFFAYWLVAHEHKFLKITTTATHGTKRFDLQEILDVTIAVPEKEEQARIVTRLDATASQIQNNVATAAKLRSLKTALMQDLLTGKKRVTPSLRPESIELSAAANGD